MCFCVTVMHTPTTLRDVNLAAARKQRVSCPSLRDEQNGKNETEWMGSLKDPTTTDRNTLAIGTVGDLLSDGCSVQCCALHSPPSFFAWGLNPTTNSPRALHLHSFAVPCQKLRSVNSGEEVHAENAPWSASACGHASADVRVHVNVNAGVSVNVNADAADGFRVRRRRRK